MGVYLFWAGNQCAVSIESVSFNNRIFPKNPVIVCISAHRIKVDKASGSADMLFLTAEQHRVSPGHTEFFCVNSLPAPSGGRFWEKLYAIHNFSIISIY